MHDIRQTNDRLWNVLIMQQLRRVRLDAQQRDDEPLSCDIMSTFHISFDLLLL